VYGIVTQNWGRVEVESEPGRGARIVIELPVAGEKQGLAEEFRAEGDGRSRLEAELLVVEDQAEGRRFVAEVLRGAGCRVHEAEDAEEALQVAEREDRLDLLLTDVSMPGMDGEELARELTRRLPGLRVLLMSGYSRREQALGWPVLAKPFGPERLVEEVRRALGGTGTGA
jgi:CheY-like chemotaxis protein